MKTNHNNAYKFKTIPKNGQSHTFFDLLPIDWQASIVPFWDTYKETSTLYVIEAYNTVIGGGIVFSKCPPDVQYLADEAAKWFSNGYLYIGFLWISEEKRGKNLGAFWIDELKRTLPGQKFWLLIEEKGLHDFYQKNGFSIVSSFSTQGQTEWLYAFHGK